MTLFSLPQKAFSIIAASILLASSASAMDLDWSGQFRAESHWVRNYSLGNGISAASSTGGYTIPGGGSSDAQFQTLFMRLQPKLVVNDNIYIKSEWWFGNPIFGFFGDAYPNSPDQRQFYSTQSRGSTVTAQRFWAEFLSDIGTVQVGRAPLHWGLGLVWHSGEGLWDRYQSTGDTVRLISKFGAFSFIPSITKYSMGNSVGGACNIGASGNCTPVTGGAGLADYSLALKYENPDEDFEGGINFIKRIAGAAQDPASGVIVPGTATASGAATGGMNFNTFDFYGRKKIGKLTVGAEIPVTSGDLGGVNYKTFAFATELNFKMSDRFEFDSRIGHAPGQADISGATAAKYRAFFFNPNYRLGLIMFNYQLANLSGQNTQNNPNGTGPASPFDNPIVNANYVTLGGTFHTGNWDFRTNFITAQAIETASGTGSFYNTWTRQYVTNTSGNSQETSLGSEIDFGTTLKWDDTFQFHFDFGWFFPGDYYRFSNSGAENATPSVFATTLRAGVAF